MKRNAKGRHAVDTQTYLQIKTKFLFFKVMFAPIRMAQIQNPTPSVRGYEEV